MSISLYIHHSNVKYYAVNDKNKYILGGDRVVNSIEQEEAVSLAKKRYGESLKYVIKETKEVVFSNVD